MPDIMLFALDTYACKYIHSYLDSSSHAYVCMNLRTICMYTYICVFAYECICMIVYMYVHTGIRERACVFKYMQIHIYTYIHLYMQKLYEQMYAYLCICRYKHMYA